MRRIFGILVLLCLLLSGCASQQRSSSLTTTLTAYASAIRWNGFEGAVQFVDPAVLAAHPISEIDQARYKQVRVSDYDTGPGPVPTGDLDAQQTAQINIVNIHTQAERSIIDHQTWRYDEAAKHWWLTSGLPSITQD